MAKQIQKGGSRSTNVQAQQVNITQGISYSEVRQIAQDVFKANFYQLASDAEDVARTRAEEITEKFLEKLEQENQEAISQAKDPDFQYALFNVQKEYARTGDVDLGDLLVDMLVDRTKEESRTLLQIVLNESLSVAPKLTPDQLAALSIAFLFRYTVFQSISNLDSLNQYLDTFVAPFVNSLTKKASCYQHLEFAGCVSIGLGSIMVEKILRDRYPGLFSRGFDADVQTNSRQISLALDHPIFTKCLHDLHKWQVNAINEETLRTRAQRLGINDEETQKLISLTNDSLMGTDEARSYLVSVREYMETLFDVWHNSSMKNLTLTSVGIAIGHANIKRSLGEFTDLSIWIS